MRSVPREQFEAHKSISPEFLLPARAGRLKSRLPQSAGGQHELAHDRTWRDDVPSGVVKGVDLLLIQDLSDDCKIERRVVDSPPEREFAAIVPERQHISGHPRFSHGALREAVPIGAQTHLKNKTLAHGPRVLRE